MVVGSLFGALPVPAATDGLVLEMSVSVTTNTYEGTPLTVSVRLSTERLATGAGTVRVEDRTNGVRTLGSATVVNKWVTIPIGTLAIGTHHLAVVYVSASGNQTLTVPADVVVLKLPPPTTTTTTTRPPTTTTSTTVATTTTSLSASTTIPPATIASTTTTTRLAISTTRATTTTTVRVGSSSSVSGTTTTTRPTATRPTTTTVLATATSEATTSTVATDSSVTSSSSAVPSAAPATVASPAPLSATTVPPDGALDITLQAGVGDPTASAPVMVQGQNVAPGSTVTVTLHSAPILLATFQADAAGAFSHSVVLPATIEPGDHRLIVAGTSRSGASLQAIAPFTVVGGRFSAIGPTTRAKALGASSAGAANPAAAPNSATKAPGVASAAPEMLAGALPDAVPALFAAAGGRYAVLTPQARSQQVIDSQIDLFTLLAMLGTAAAPAAAVAVAKRDAARADETKEAPPDRSREEIAVGDAAVLAFASGQRGRGDESNTWALLGTENFDEVTKALPGRVGRFSPLLARVFADGTYLRAMFGGMWLLGPLIGLLVGEGAGLSANGRFLPPATGWVIALLVVGLFDAFSGLIGAAVYLLNTLAIGGIPSGDGLRATLGLVTLWFGPVLIAAAIRPLRRVHPSDPKAWWERMTDGALAPLFAAWGARGLAGAQNGLSGLSLPIAESASTIGLVVLVVMFARFLLESCAAYFYPERLSLTDAGSIAKPSWRQLTVSTIGRAALFVFCAIAVVPWRWQLFIALGLFAVPIFLPRVVNAFDDRLPNSDRVFRWTPTGLAKTLVLLFAGLALAGWLGRHQPDSKQRMLDSLWMLALPGFVFALLGVFGRDGERPTLRWWHRFVGIPLVALLVYLKF